MVPRASDHGANRPHALSPSYEIVGTCPACGAGGVDVIVDAEEVQDETEALWAFHTRRIRGDTAPGHLLDRSAFSQRPPLGIAACHACGTLVRNPREDAETLHDTYADEQPDAEALEALHAAQRRSAEAQVRRLQRVLGRRGSVLEVGSYVGGFLEAANTAGWQAEGVDVNEVAVAFARARGLTVHQGTIGEVHPDRRYDAIAFWNCLEQLDDPAQALVVARARLNIGGVLAVRVPNGGFYRAWRTARPRVIARALLAHNNLLSFPYRHGFTLRALRLMLERADLDVTKVRGDALVSTADEHTRRWARAEERMVKGGMRAALPRNTAPWLEVYARARQTPQHAVDAG